MARQTGRTLGADPCCGEESAENPLRSPLVTSLPVDGTSFPALLREHASTRPDEVAYTFIDYLQDWDGAEENLTWSQVHRRVLNVARELRRCAYPGDRAVILAPQGLDYIIGFLGAVQAGLIAVPLSVPMGGAADERVDSVLDDASPAVVLTTSAVVDRVAPRVAPLPGHTVAAVLEIDRLNLDAPIRSDTGPEDHDQTVAYLQYTSGSTRRPAGVMITYDNLHSNYELTLRSFFARIGGVKPPNHTLVGWLPFFHDFGLIMGVCTPVLSGCRAVLTSPEAFLQRPARWMQMVASYPDASTGGPNFAFDLAVRKTSDEDMAGYDLGNVATIISGAEWIRPDTLQRFAERFKQFNLRESALRPTYGLAEATLYVATITDGQPPLSADFEPEKLSAGQAQRCASGTGTTLVGYPERGPDIRIVDPDTHIESPDGKTGEVWVHGGNVGAGYWHRREETERTFRATIVEPSAGTPDGPWLRTGDLGFVCEGTLFIVGRIKDLLIIRGRNHSPEDIEATVQKVTGSRAAAIAVRDDGTEQLVVVMEVKARGSEEEARQAFEAVKREVNAAISTSHVVGVSDLVLVSPGSIPVTTSGKIRRSACAELYAENRFARLDT